MHKSLFILALTGLSVLGGCASSGTRVTETQASQFQNGIATRSQVVEKLGDPQQTTKLSDGSRIDVYVRIEAHANAASYIPVVGLFAGGAKSSSTTAAFTYGPDGVLKNVQTSEGHNSVNTGLINH